MTYLQTFNEIHEENVKKSDIHVDAVIEFRDEKIAIYACVAVPYICLVANSKLKLH